MSTGSSGHEINASGRHGGAMHGGVSRGDGHSVNSDNQSISVHAHHANAGFHPLSLLMNWLPLRPTALMTFSTVTGAAGSISLRLGWTHPLAHAFSITAGYGVSMLIGVVLPKKMRRAQNTSAAERYELIGLPAKVTSAILEGGFGRISYSVRDNSYGAPARHIDGRRVEQGERVVVCEIKKNVFYVTELNIQQLQTSESTDE